MVRKEAEENHVLDISDVDVILGGKQILRTVDFWVETNKKVGLIGPNGSGKTTLLRAIYRRCEPIRGTIFV